MERAIRFCWQAAVVLVVLVTVGPGVQALAADETASSPAVARVEESLEGAHAAVAEGRAADAGRALADTGRALEALADLGREVEPETIRRLATACKDLAFELRFDGVAVDGLPDARDLLRRRAEQMRKSPSRGSAPPRPMQPVAVGPSFAGQIAPLLVQACGRCHVEGSRGDFNMESYAALAQTGMVVAGDGLGSRLVEVIRTGDMPRGGGQIAPAEFAALVAWIDAGAVFDGADPTASLDKVVPAAAMTEVARAAEPTKPGAPRIGPDDVPFSSAVAGILVENCGRCHGGRNPSADFSIDTFNDLADSGAIEPGRGAESLLVRKLLGVNIDGQRMPRGRPPLADEEITVIRTWIDEGAKLDLLEGTDELSRIASEGRSRNLSHEQLRSVRFEAAPLLWRRGIVDEEGVVEQRGDLTVIGNLAGDRLATAANAAADVEQRVRQELRLTGPLTKGGMAVFLFARGYDFSNFWQNVLGRERPGGLLGLADVSGDVVYAAVAVDGDADNERLMLAAEITAAALRARGAPGWFSEAAGRVLARQIAPEAAAIGIWDDAEVLARNSLPPSPDRLFAAGLSAEQVATATAMLASVDREGRRLTGLVKRLDDGDDFDAAFRQTYRMLPARMLLNWTSRGR